MEYKKTVVTDKRISKKTEDNLHMLGFEIIKLPECEFLQQPVCAHPDMLIYIDKNKLVCNEKYYKIAKKEIDMICKISDSELILSCERYESEYPFDVLFNVAKIGNKIICRKESTSEHILQMYKNEDIINVKQGYAKCSCVTISDKAIITYDKKIAKKAENNGIKSLVVSDEGVELLGYSCGFIGGASGFYDNIVYFCGDINLHRDGEKIKNFCKSLGVDIISLCDEPLYDFGTLIFL